MASARAVHRLIEVLDEPHREMAYRADEATVYARRLIQTLGTDHPDAQAAHEVALDAREELYASFRPPPSRMNVLDRHGGFTIETTKPWDAPDRFDFAARERAARARLDYRRFDVGGDLWRPGSVLKGREPVGDLIAYDPRSFYQTNDNVTLAVYRVRGYGFPVLVWFDNATRERIA